MRRTAAFAAVALAGVLAAASAAAAPPPGFVYLADIDPTIRQDMRYAGANNFMDRKLPGYDAAECILQEDAAEALRRVQAELAPDGLGLKVLDCYRPNRAVRAMADWAADGRPAGAGKRYFPNLDKSKLHALGYIARRSTHATGVTVDLALVRLDIPPGAAPETGLCTGPFDGRSAADEVDMGTGYDCLDPKSHLGAKGLTAEEEAARERLARVMEKHGFDGYDREWWHFVYERVKRPPAQDFPIPPR
jgi:D-alanyl-D-alanine dipeptidase